VQLVTSQVSTSGAFVWGVIEYRWLPMFDTDAVRSGVATIVIARLKDGTWRIVHLHSSSPTPFRER
ncbi:MAG TPA: nuclear transport factor 2 family protein, partial [Gemmatimonadales bacterium]|nr:nuclear transport factor 2 family protein [Gemmatimonadales bacterium]